MREKDKLNMEFSGKNIIATVIACAMIGAIFFLYLYNTKVRIDEYGSYTLKNHIDMAAVSIDSQLSDAKRSIMAASGEVSAKWKEDDAFDIVALVDSIKEDYIFDVLEFVDVDGINLMSGSNRFDASDREYYKEGIQGKTGLWVNYTPKESKEFLLDYYSPVYHNDKIVGVLVGALGSKQSLEPITQATFFGREIIGVLFNEEERAIAASFGVENEIYSADIYEMFNLTQRDKEIFSEHVKAKDSIVFQYEGEKGEGLACVNPIDEHGWGLVIIIPSNVFSSVYGDFTTSELKTLGAISIIVCMFILYLLGVSLSKYKVKLKENSDIIEGFSTVYHSVFVLDYTDGVARCLKTRDPVAGKYDISEGKEVPISENFIEYILSNADEKSTERLSPLTNVMYVRTMIESGEFFVVEFNRVTGSKGRIAIACLKDKSNSIDEKNETERRIEKKTENERYLMGLSELG